MASEGLVARYPGKLKSIQKESAYVEVGKDPWEGGTGLQSLHRIADTCVIILRCCSANGTVLIS